MPAEEGFEKSSGEEQQGSSPHLSVTQHGRNLKGFLCLFSRKLTVHSWDQVDGLIKRKKWHLNNKQSMCYR